MGSANWVLVGVVVIAVAGTVTFFAHQQVTDRIGAAVKPAAPDNMEITDEGLHFKDPSIEELSLRVSAAGYSPNKLVADRYDVVHITITSTDGLAHGFVLPAYDVVERIEPGEATEVELYLDKYGVFPFYSNVPSNQNVGNIKGSFVVNEVIEITE